MVKGFNPQHIHSLRFFRNLAYNKIADLPADVFLPVDQPTGIVSFPLKLPKRLIKKFKKKKKKEIYTEQITILWGNLYQ